ncbi:hypothetical protein ACRALDRAFT_1059921, partial [Sodiomyces alcalophilus JCM 7366]|uniref:uncharacterized protein n=1 Tax=Sodiomyces alcalophilus JCM 7366 TaxID=591952 RepID=UPI0039B5CF45
MPPPIIPGQTGPFWPLKRHDDTAPNVLAASGCTPTVDRPTLVARQNGPATATVTVTEIPVGGNNNQGGGDNSLSGGAIAGIVIGSIFGTLLLLWIIRSLCNLGGAARQPGPWYGEKERHHHHHHRHRSPHRRRSRGRRRSSSISAPPPV